MSTAISKAVASDWQEKVTVKHFKEVHINGIKVGNIWRSEDGLASLYDDGWLKTSAQGYHADEAEALKWFETTSKRSKVFNSDQG